MTKTKNNLAEDTRKDFPLFKEKDNCKPLVYLDHAATSQKPFQVIEALKNYYFFSNANVHRGAHQLSSKATQAFEAARETTAKFINASSAKEIIFTRNATEAINLVAKSWGKIGLKEGDEILLSIMEHHSNIVPWQMIAQEKKCKIKYVGITEQGILDINDLKSKLGEKTKIVSLVHVSNTLGCCNPIKEINNLIKKTDALFCLDACQSLAHKKIDVNDLDIDFLAGSSHKLCGPTGIGFLWAKERLLEVMEPTLGGGEMINEVSLDKSTWADLPHKFEAGTPAIGEAIGLAEAIKYITETGLNNIKNYENDLKIYLFKRLAEIDELSIIGPDPFLDKDRAALATFYIENLHSNDLAEILDANSVCIRSGHHCCQPLHKHLGLTSTARASMSFTTTKYEIDILISEIKDAITFFKINS